MADKGSVVITGASTGIGWGTAKVLLARGHRVFGTVRKQTDGERLRREFGEAFTPLLLDVTDERGISQAAEEVATALGHRRLAGLVNNAGIGIAGPLLHVSPEDVRWQMEVNLLGPLRMVQAFAPLLGTDREREGAPGRIVQISSVGGKMGVPFLGPYIASKHALEGMSEVLRRELMLFGIDVVVIGPGSVATPMFDKAEQMDLSSFDGTVYAPMLKQVRDYMVREGRKGLRPEQLGEAVYTALTARKPKVRYAVVPQRFKNWTVPRLLPKRVVDRFMAKQFGLQRAVTAAVK